MIVKNENGIIQRCLESVKPFIDYWVIVDTGSTDGTQESIHQIMKEIPGELYERPWVDFSYNRNEALSFAKGKGDYLLLIDADESWHYPPEFQFPNLNKDCYFITVKEPSANHQRICLIDMRLNWQWVGVLHESLLSDNARTFDLLQKIENRSNSLDGARSKDPNKYLKDAALLEEALIQDPNNSRYMFYLAQSYQNAGKLERALKTYQKRALMGGWEEEIFWSLYQEAFLEEHLQMNSEFIIQSYCRAHQFRPTRVEPLYRLAQYYLEQGNFLLSYLTSKHGLNLPIPNDQIFVETWMYEYGIWIVFANAAYETKNYQEAKKACERILQYPYLTKEVRARIEANRSMCEFLK